MNTSDLAIFIGRFHPLVVHLPIGFLILSFLMWLYEKWRGGDAFRAAISFSLILGTLSAAAACILGYLLSTGGGYDGQLLNTHMWAGIATTLVAGLAFAAYTYGTNRLKSPIVLYSAFGVMMLGLSATGHVGGSLTHGADYLTAYAPFTEKPKEKLPPSSLSEVVVFDHVITPILKQKCSSCHREGKMKGQLSFASAEAILKGGKHGPVIIPHQAEASELVKRVHLPAEDKHFMPPEGKTPLTDKETAILELWINSGASFTAQVTELSLETKEKKQLAAYLGFDADGVLKIKKQLLKPDLTYLDKLRTKGFVIRELFAGSDHYEVTYPAYKRSDAYPAKEILADLKPMSSNIIWLNVSDLNITDEDLSVLPEMPNLIKLRIEKNNITDKGLALLTGLSTLEVLNVYANPITAASQETLAKFPDLKKIYGWQTDLKPADTTRYQLVL